MNNNRSSTQQHTPAMLKKEEIIELAKKMSEGDIKAREKLIVSHLWIVEKIVASRIHSVPSSVDKNELYQDLYQEGCYGLIEAINKYDWTRNVYISTYAFDYVRKYILKFLRENIPMIRLPEKVYYACYKYRKFANEFFVENSRNPTIEESCEALGMEEDVLKAVLKHNYLLSNIYGKDEVVMRFEEDVTDEMFFEGPEVVIDKLAGPDFSEYGVFLTQREEDVLSLKFGYKGNCPMSFREIGEACGFSEELARTTYHTAINKIKEKIQL